MELSPDSGQKFALCFIDPRFYSLRFVYYYRCHRGVWTLRSGDEMPERNDDAYWKANIRLVLSLLAVWFLVSFGAGILLVEVLDNIRMGGFKLGFWMAQQGSIFVFIVLIFVYIKRMDKLDARYRRSESDRKDAAR